MDRGKITYFLSNLAQIFPFLIHKDSDVKIADLDQNNFIFLLQQEVISTNFITHEIKQLSDGETTVGTLSDLELSRNPSKCTITQKNSSQSSSAPNLNETKSVITSHSFKSRSYSQKWTSEESKLFFRALSLFGTDFSMITLMFQGRNRSQIINKFHKEEKEHPEKIEQSLMSHKHCSSRLLNRYSDFLQNAQRNAIEVQIVKKKRSESMDSVDETIYEELNKCLKSGIGKMQDQFTHRANLSRFQPECPSRQSKLQNEDLQSPLRQQSPSPLLRLDFVVQ